MKKISVLMSAYNSVETLDEAILSILNQSYSDFEFIIIDDGSSDGTREKLLEFSKIDNRIRLHFNEVNMGLMKSLNKGIGLCQGEWIARMDSDDISKVNRFSSQIEFLEKNPSVLVLGSNYQSLGAFEFLDTLYNLPSGKVNEVLTRENVMCHSSIMIKKDLVIKLGGYRDYFKNSEDYDLWLRASRICDVYNLAEPLIRIRLSLGGATISRRREMIVYAELARRSFRYPDQDLHKLKLAIEQESSSYDVAKDTKDSFKQLTKSLIKLGHWPDAWKAYRIYKSL